MFPPPGAAIFALRIFMDGTIPENELNVLKSMNAFLGIPSGIGKGKKDIVIAVPADKNYRFRAIAVHATDGVWTKNNTWQGFTRISAAGSTASMLTAKPVTTAAEKTAFEATAVGRGACHPACAQRYGADVEQS